MFVETDLNLDAPGQCSEALATAVDSSVLMGTHLVTVR